MGIPMFGYLHCFYLKNHCFYSFVCYFFAPAAPKLLRVTTETVRESTNKQTSQTDTSEEWNILTRREMQVVLCRDAPQARKFWVLWFKNRISKCKNTFLKAFWSVFAVETHEKVPKFSASGQDYDLTPPCWKMLKYKGGVKYKGGG